MSFAIRNLHVSAGFMEVLIALLKAEYCLFLSPWSISDGLDIFWIFAKSSSVRDFNRAVRPFPANENGGGVPSYKKTHEDATLKGQLRKKGTKNIKKHKTQTHPNPNSSSELSKDSFRRTSIESIVPVLSILRSSS